MGTLLYQWSTAAQLVSVFMIALFYATLTRSVQRAEVRWWAQAWWCNFAALALTLVYWITTPPPIASAVIRSLYVGWKIAYALLLMQGVMALRKPGTEWLSRRTFVGIVTCAALVAVTVLTTIDRIGIATQGAMGLLFVWCGVLLIRARHRLPAWLAFGFLARGMFSLIEAAAYAVQTLPAGALSPHRAEQLGMFLGAHSSIDLAAEWLLALGGVLALAQRGQRELETTNVELLSAQDELRRLADRDPLTGLANRRALPEAFRSVFDTGAAIVFFDLDAFKQVNDTHGHAAGDVYLVRFATALRTAFRPSDAMIRYAGDEFVVVAAGMTIPMAEDRVAILRATLDIAFSAGISELVAGGDSEMALKAADEAMYAVKSLGG